MVDEALETFAGIGVGRTAVAVLERLRPDHRARAAHQIGDDGGREFLVLERAAFGPEEEFNRVRAVGAVVGDHGGGVVPLAGDDVRGGAQVKCRLSHVHAQTVEAAVVTHTEHPAAPVAPVERIVVDPTGVAAAKRNSVPAETGHDCGRVVQTEIIDLDGVGPDLPQRVGLLLETQAEAAVTSAAGRTYDRGVGPERAAEHAAHAGRMPAARTLHRRRAPVALVADLIRCSDIHGQRVVVRIVVEMPPGGSIVIHACMRKAWRDGAEHRCTQNNRTCEALYRPFHGSLL